MSATIETECLFSKKQVILALTGACIWGEWHGILLENLGDFCRFC